MKNFNLNSKLLIAILAVSVSSVALAKNDSHEEHKADHGRGHEAKIERITNVLPQPMPNTKLSTLPSQPTLVSPKSYEVVKAQPVQLKWSSSEGADQYHLQVATDVNFKWLVEDQPFVTSTETTLNLEKGKNYFWRVAAVKSQNVATHRKSNFAGGTFEVQ